MGQQGLHLPGQPDPVTGAGGGADLAHQPRQGVQSQPALGVQPVPVPVRVLHQVLRPLEQQGKHVVEVLPPLLSAAASSLSAVQPGETSVYAAARLFSQAP